MANEKGTYSNPYTYEEFEDLLNEGHWNGGHVIYEGVTYYYNCGGIRDNDGCDGCGEGCGCGCGEGCGEGCGCGCGSGCGSGEGCGCGCGNGYLREGQESFRPNGWGVGLAIVVAWESGSFSALNQPSVSAAFYVASNNVGLPLSASWDGSYRVKITGTINLVDDNGNILNDYNVSEYYNIPGSYYN